MHSIHRFRHARLLAVLVLAAAVALPAGGSTFVTMDLNELVAKSDAAIEGRVISLQTYWDESHSVIVTDAVVAVDEKLFGRSAGEIVVRTFGGEVDGYTVQAVGFPRFEQDEQLLLFVHRPDTPDGKLRVTGYQLGHYRIVREGDEMAAVPALDDGARFVSPSGGRTTPPAARSLDELKDEIRSAARAQRKGGR